MVRACQPQYVLSGPGSTPNHVCYNGDAASRLAWPAQCIRAGQTPSRKATQTRAVRETKHTRLDNPRRNPAKRHSANKLSSVQAQPQPGQSGRPPHSTDPPQPHTSEQRKGDVARAPGGTARSPNHACDSTHSVCDVGRATQKKSSKRGPVCHNKDGAVCRWPRPKRVSGGG